MAGERRPVPEYGAGRRLGTGMVFQAAAEAAVAGFVATDLHIHYLAQAKAGPARTGATVLRRSADHAVCAVEVVDAGDGDRLLALASVGLESA